MGLFRKLFKKPITANKSSLDNVVSLAFSGSVKLNKALDVPPGYICFLVCKEKVCDRFTEGNYKLDLQSIPVACRTTKLNVPNKNGNYKNSFKADVYYVKLDEVVGQKFESINGIDIKKDKDFLRFNAYCKGYYSYVVKDPALLLESLLDCAAIIKGNMAQRQLDIWTAFNVDKLIEKNKPSALQIYERQSVCFEGLIDYLNKHMQDVGIEYTQVDVTETILPKKVYKKVELKFTESNTQMAYQNVIDKTQQMNSKIEETLTSTNITLQPVENQLFGNTEEDFELDKNKYENAVQENYQEDLLDKHYDIEQLQQKVTYKQCKKCGAYCSKNANVCYNCKSEFVKICDKCGAEIKNGDFVCPNCKAIII